VAQDAYCARLWGGVAAALVMDRVEREESASARSATTSLDLPAADDADKAQTGSGHPERIRLIVPVRLKRRGNEMKFIVEGGAIAEEPRIDENLVRLVVRGGSEPGCRFPRQSLRHDRRYCRRRRIWGDLRRSPSSFDVSRPGHRRSDSRRTAAVGADRQRAHDRSAAASGMVGAASGARVSRKGRSLRAAQFTRHSAQRNLRCERLGDRLASAMPFPNSPNPRLYRCLRNVRSDLVEATARPPHGRNDAQRPPHHEKRLQRIRGRKLTESRSDWSLRGPSVSRPRQRSEITPDWCRVTRYFILMSVS
jgi:hypothetical protein